MSLPVAILAGGLATRLRPITEKIPKSLIEIAGRPFIAWQLEALARQGIRNVVICTGFLGEAVMEVVGDGHRYGVNVAYSPDGPVLLGTGGALKQALPLLGQSFFVLYGDSFLPIDFLKVEEAFFHEKKPGLMTVLRNRNQWDTSNVIYNDGCLKLYDKKIKNPEMEFIDYGLGVLSAGVFDRYAAGQHFDLADLYNRLSKDGELAGYEVFERFYEIGSHSGIRETEEFFLMKGGE